MCESNKEGKIVLIIKRMLLILIYIRARRRLCRLGVLVEYKINKMEQKDRRCQIAEEDYLLVYKVRRHIIKGMYVCAKKNKKIEKQLVEINLCRMVGAVIEGAGRKKIAARNIFWLRHIRLKHCCTARAYKNDERGIVKEQLCNECFKYGLTVTRNGTRCARRFSKINDRLDNLLVIGEYKDESTGLTMLSGKYVKMIVYRLADICGALRISLRAGTELYG
jgi:hypothetical protein